MKSKHKTYLFFIILALLFWNPISYFIFYANTPIFSKLSIKMGYWVIFLSGILLFFLIKKNKLNLTIKNIVFALTLTGIIFATLVTIDRVVGYDLKKEVTQVQKQVGIIFEPNSKARYQTIEFDFDVNTNSLGLRDREINIDKDDKYRILAFGDAWTYGWGINIENSWPKKLEQYLIARGFKNIEVVNCGQAGAYTRNYKKYAEKAVPLLKPDLILVAVTMPNDLLYIYNNHFLTRNDDVVEKKNYQINITYLKYFIHKIFNNSIHNTFKEIKSIISGYLKASFENILTLISNRKPETIEIESNWKKWANNLIEKFNYEQKVRFSTLDDTVQSLFKSGDLNPRLLNYYTNFSLTDNYAIFNNPNHPATQFAIKEMKKDFNDIKSISDQNSSNLVLISFPTNNFTGHLVIRTPSDVFSSYFQKNNNIDSIFRSVASANKLPYMNLTTLFLSLPNKTEHFFKYDGHPNKKGHEEIANYIGKQLIEKKYLGSLIPKEEEILVNSDK